MLNRRHLRVKVLQVLYSFAQSENKDKLVFEKILLQQIEKVREMYLYMLQLLEEMAEYVETDALESAEKYVPSEIDLNPNRSLAQNKIIHLLQTNSEFIARLKSSKVSWQKDHDIVRSLFKTLKKKAEYETYGGNEVNNFDTDKDFLLYIFKKIIMKSVVVKQWFEEHDINWNSNEAVINSMVSKTIKSFTEESNSEHFLASVSANWEDDEEFIINLYRKTQENDVRFDEIIGKKTENWDIERIAMLDVILMKMALSEFLYFNGIPLKVTMNEYIDISKEYSTPKSNTFINGILDKILIDFNVNKEIRKTGRGLIGS